MKILPPCTAISEPLFLQQWCIRHVIAFVVDSEIHSWSRSKCACRMHSNALIRLKMTVEELRRTAGIQEERPDIAVVESFSDYHCCNLLLLPFTWLLSWSLEWLHSSCYKIDVYVINLARAMVSCSCGGDVCISVMSCCILAWDIQSRKIAS